MSAQGYQENKDLEMMTMNKKNDEPLLPSASRGKQTAVMHDDESLVVTVTSRVS